MCPAAFGLGKGGESSGAAVKCAPEGKRPNWRSSAPSLAAGDPVREQDLSSKGKVPVMVVGEGGNWWKCACGQPEDYTNWRLSCTVGSGRAIRTWCFSPSGISITRYATTRSPCIPLALKETTYCVS